MAKFLGTAKIKINGGLVKTVPGSVELEYGGKTRESVMADGQFNFNEKDVPTKLSFKMLHTSKTQMKKVNELADGMVEVETDIGKTYTITSAARMGDPIKTKDSDGQVDVSIEGDPIPED